MNNPFLSTTVVLVLCIFVFLHTRTSYAYFHSATNRRSSSATSSLTKALLKDFRADCTQSSVTTTSDVIPTSSSSPFSPFVHEQSPISLKQLSSKSVVASTLAVTLMLFSMSTPQTALAESDDKGYSLCLSKCIYAGTRPPPQGSSIERLEVTPPRSEIIKDCKEKCTLKTGYVPPKKEKVKKSE